MQTVHLFLISSTSSSSSSSSFSLPHSHISHSFTHFFIHSFTHNRFSSVWVCELRFAKGVTSSDILAVLDNNTPFSRAIGATQDQLNFHVPHTHTHTRERERERAEWTYCTSSSTQTSKLLMMDLSVSWSSFLPYRWAIVGALGLASSSTWCSLGLTRERASLKLAWNAELAVLRPCRPLALLPRPIGLVFCLVTKWKSWRRRAEPYSTRLLTLSSAVRSESYHIIYIYIYTHTDM